MRMHARVSVCLREGERERERESEAVCVPLLVCRTDWRASWEVVIMMIMLCYRPTLALSLLSGMLALACIRQWEAAGSSRTQAVRLAAQAQQVGGGWHSVQKAWCFVFFPPSASPPPPRCPSLAHSSAPPPSCAPG